MKQAEDNFIARNIVDFSSIGDKFLFYRIPTIS